MMNPWTLPSASALGPSSPAESRPLRRKAWPALALLACLCASCSSHRPRWEATWQSPGAEFDPGEELALRAARTYYDEGKLQAALDLLRPVARDAQDNLELGFWLQDLAGERAAKMGLETEPLVTAYGQRAQSDPTPASLILAARLMEGAEALALLATWSSWDNMLRNSCLEPEQARSVIEFGFRALLGQPHPTPEV